ncbi:sulfur transferase domain-containing protein [Alphaproteobacteria bacterium LSUCC0684]
MTAQHPRRGLRDWLDLMLKDHGFLRLWWHNLDEFRPGIWRSNQPTPGRVKVAAAQGIKTIINLRGPRSDGGWRLEKEACDAAGITLVDFTIRSRAVPDRETVLAARELFQSVEYPILMHCKSGADRAGIMSALYLLLMEDADPATAAEMLSLRYLHVRQAKTGLLDAFVAAYAPAAASGTSFLDWARHDLDPEAIAANFHSSTWAERLVDQLLRRE